MSPILRNYHYSALDLLCTFLQSHIFLSLVLFLINNPQNVFGQGSSKRSALFHLP